MYGKRGCVSAPISARRFPSFPFTRGGNRNSAYSRSVSHSLAISIPFLVAFRFLRAGNIFRVNGLPANDRFSISARRISRSYKRAFARVLRLSERFLSFERFSHEVCRLCRGDCFVAGAYICLERSTFETSCSIGDIKGVRKIYIFVYYYI